MQVVAAIWLVLAARASPAATPPTIYVQLPSDSRPCRIDGLIAAIQLRRRGVEVRPGAPAAAGDIAVVVSSEGGAWELTVTSGDLEPLRRALPRPGPDCTATTDTAALMIDRYLADIHWAGPEAALARAASPAAQMPSPAPTSPSTGAPVTAAVAPASSPPAAAATLAPAPAELTTRSAPRASAGSRQRYQLVVELAPALGASPVGALPFLQLEVAIRRGWLQLGLGGSAALPQHQPISSSTPDLGNYAVQLGSIEVIAAARLHLGPGTVRLELLPGTELLWVGASQGSGPKLFQLEPGFGPSPFIGGRIGYELALPGSFAIALRAEGRWLVQRAGFTVEGYSGGISTPPIDGNVSLALSRIFF